MKTLPRDFELAVRVFVYFVETGAERATVDDICERQQMAKNYVIKIARSLTAANLLVSFKGFHGGFAPARPAKTITLLDIWRAMGEELSINKTCFHVDSGACTTCTTALETLRNAQNAALERVTIGLLTKATSKKSGAKG